KNSLPMKQADKMFKVFSRPQLDLNNILQFKEVKQYLNENQLDDEIIEQVYIQLKYSGYIEKEINNAEKLNRLEDVKIPDNFDYDKVKSLSYESREKFKK